MSEAGSTIKLNKFQFYSDNSGDLEEEELIKTQSDFNIFNFKENYHFGI